MFGIQLHLFLFIIFVNLFSSANCEIPPTVFCADPQCSEPISEAQGVILYQPGEEYVLGFNKGAKILIMSKTKEKRGYWGAKIEDKYGFVPTSAIKEIRVFKSMDKLVYEVPSIVAKQVPSGNENLNQGNSVGKEGNKPEKQNDIPQASLQSSLTNIIHGGIHPKSDEFLKDGQKPELRNLENEIVEVTSATVLSDPEVNTNASTTLKSFELDGQKKSKIEGKTVEKSSSVEVTHIKSSEKKNTSSGSEILQNNVVETPILRDSDSPSEDRFVENQVSLGHKSTSEPEILTNEVNVNEKNHAKNPKQNEDILSSVAETDKQKITSSNIEISDSSNKVYANFEQETIDNIEERQVTDKNDTDGLTEAQEKTSKVPPVKSSDPLVLPGTESPVKSSHVYVNQHANNLSNQNRGDKNKTQLESDTGTVNDINGTLSKEALNVGVKESSVQENSSHASDSVSSSSRSSKSSVGNAIHVNHADPMNPGQSGLPSHEFQKIGSTTNEVYSSGAQFGQASREAHNHLNSPPQPDPSMAISPGHVPYNHVKQRKNSKDEVPPFPISVGEAKIVDVPPTVNINIKQASNQNTEIQTGVLSEVDNIKPTEGSVSASYDPSSYSKIAEPGNKIEDLQKTAASESINHSNEDHNFQVEKNEKIVYSGDMEYMKHDSVSGNVIEGGHTNSGLLETEKSVSQNQNDEVEQIEAEEKDERDQPGNVEEILVENFDHKLPTDLPADMVAKVPDISEKPENSNFEYSTPVPSLEKVKDSQQIDKEIQDIQESENEKIIGEEGFLSSLGKTALSWVGLVSEKQPPLQEGNLVEESVLNGPPSPELNTKENAIIPDGTCKASDGSTIKCQEATTDENSSLWSFWLDSKISSPASSYNTFIYLVVTAVTVLLFTLGYYFIEKFRSDGPLIAKVNKLEQELLVSSKECLILKDELMNTKEKLNLFETSSNDKIITALQQELEESKKIRSELENNIEVLQQELDAATEAGLDLNRMLSEVLTQKGGSETLMESVEHLQAQLNSQQKIIDEMTTKLFTKTTENQELQDELTAANEKIESLEGEIEDMRGNLNVHLKDNEDVIKELKSKNSELQLKINQMNETKDKEIGKLKKNVSEFEKKLKATSDSLQIKEEECNILKDSVKKIKLKDGKSIDSLFESSRIKAELGQATNENSSLKDQLKTETEKIVKLESKVKKLDEEIQKLREISSEAEKKKSEAQTRLEVLSNYFKEKETQLQKELGLREAMWVQKQGDDSTIYEKIKSLEEEISNYKSQNEALKKEILDQERGLKAQITTLEKKAHENWIAARQAERKLEETKQEAAQLRNKMTLMEKNISNDLESSQHLRVNDELNGGDALSPLMHDTSSPILFPPPLPLDPNNTSLMPPGFIPPMFMPPPPGGFMPHPPPFLPGDHRPPPLGRMSSPPLNNRFSPPPPPDYAYDRMSTPPLSPSSRNYRSPNESDRERERFRHRTPTSPSFRSRNWDEGPSTGMAGFRPITNERDSRREHKGGSNMSSGHSSDSLDKASRHSSRV